MAGNLNSGRGNSDHGNIDRGSIDHLNIDHVVIAAIDLEQGVRYVREQLGVDIPFGGEHPLMGTHNHLMQLGEAVFLEVIAVNPLGEQPLQPRWYGLDDPYVRARIVEEPTLVGWVVNTSSIDAVLAAASVQGRDFGKTVPVTRGNLKWKFGLPDDGRLLAAGMLPYIIEWDSNTHPAALMADTGCRLVRLVIEHPHRDWLQQSLQGIGASGLVTVVDSDAPALSVTIDSPNGSVTLHSPRLT